MSEAPLSFLTGFGWGAYDAMPFRFATHNHYLALWFDLGLVGLTFGAALLIVVLRIASRAVPAASGAYRAVLAPFVVGTLAIMIAAFFVNLFTPWLWYWAYAGLAMRIAVNARTVPEHAVPTAPRPTGAPGKDAFGWVVAEGSHR